MTEGITARLFAVSDFRALGLTDGSCFAISTSTITDAGELEDGLLERFDLGLGLTFGFGSGSGFRFGSVQASGTAKFKGGWSLDLLGFITGFGDRLFKLSTNSG